MGTIHIAAKCLKKITFHNRRASIKILNKTVASRIATTSLPNGVARIFFWGGANFP